MWMDDEEEEEREWGGDWRIKSCWIEMMSIWEQM